MLAGAVGGRDGAPLQSFAEPEKRLAPRRCIAKVAFAFRPEIRAVFVFNQTIVYHA